MKTQFTLFFCCLSMTTLAYSQTTREHDSHAHGIGNLNVVLEGDELAIELISPAANIVGFEHAPSTDEQKAAIHEARETFEQADKLFVLSESAGCKAEHVHVESELLEERDDEHAHEDHADEHAHEEDHDDEHAHEEHSEEHHDEHEHEDHADEHHDDEHAHEKHDDEHAHEHKDEHEHEEEVHSEFHVEYEFHCDDVEKLTEVQVNLFETFPATETLNVQLLTPDQQTAISLDKDNTNIEL